MPITIEVEIDRAALLGQLLEDLAYNKSRKGKLIVIDKNDDLLMGYWSLIEFEDMHRDRVTPWHQGGKDNG